MSNPGSDEAIAEGCRCPVLDNAHGKGSNFIDGAFWVSGDCPIHRVELEEVSDDE